jgi:hypothetical protein
MDLGMGKLWELFGNETASPNECNDLPFPNSGNDIPKGSKFPNSHPPFRVGMDLGMGMKPRRNERKGSKEVSKPEQFGKRVAAVIEGFQPNKTEEKDNAKNGRE